MPSMLFRDFLRISAVIFLLLILVAWPAFSARAVWDGQYYEQGETLDPECAPADTNCDVNPVTDAAHGGTGLTSYTAGDLLYATSASALGKLALGVDGKVLKVVGGVLAWADDSTGTAFTASGEGLELSGSTFALELDGATLTKSASGLRLSATYAGQNTITTLGTIATGVWNGTAIGDAYLTKSGDWTGTLDGTEGAAFLARANHTGSQVASTISDFSAAVAALLSTGNGLVVNGTAFGLVLDGSTLTKSIDGLRLSSTYAGQNTITTLGTIATGVWNGTAIGDTYLTKSGNWTGTFDGIEGAAYAILAGQAGGQTLIGGTAANNTLVIQGNSASSGNTTTNTAIDMRVGDSATSAFTILNSGNIGINTSSANITGFSSGHRILTIKGETSSAGHHELTTGSSVLTNDAFLGSFNFGNNTTTVARMLAKTNGTAGTSGDLVFYTANVGSSTEKVRITADGKFGIGVNPTHKLDIVGGALATTQRALSVTGTLSGTVGRQIGIGGTFTTSAGNTNENDGLYISLTGSNVSSAYNIAGIFGNTVAGIGTSVVGGAANYGFYGDVSATTVGTNIGAYGQASGGTISIGSSGNSVTAKDSGINIGVLGLGRNTGTSGIQLGGYFGLSSTAPTFASAALLADNSSTTSPIFMARDNGTEVFRIDDGGKVGIGITSPQQLLDVSSSQPIVRVTNTTNLSGVLWAGTEIGRLEFYNTDGSQPSVAANISVLGSADSSGGVAAGDLAFFTKNPAGSLLEKMRITDNGMVGIGNTAPGSYSLRLTATRQAASGDLAVASLENAGTSSADVLVLKQTGEAGSAESTFINFFTNAGAIGNIASNGSGVVSYNTTSDRRLKDNIEDTEYGIDDVLKISVREYTMRQDPKGMKQTGFIAQELAAIYPDAVSANGDDGLSALNGMTPWSIDYGRLTPLLVKSVQDQQLLLGAIADKDGLSELSAQAQDEDPLSAYDFISRKISDGWRPLLNFAALRVTALRAYVDEVFARRTHQEELCIGTPGNETCLNKTDLDALLNNRIAPSQPQASPPPTVDVPALITEETPPAPPATE